MNSYNEEALARLAAAGLEKCLAKMTAVSPGEWRRESISVRGATAREALRSGERAAGRRAVVRIKVKGAVPFSTALLFDPEDIGHLSACFADESFYGPLSAEQTDVSVVEIGNIVLNALVNSLLRAFGMTAIPSVPAYFTGDAAAIEERLGAGPGTFTVVSSRLTVQRGGRTAAAELLAFLPSQLTAQAPDA